MNNASVKNVLLIVEGAKREPQLMERMFDSFSLADDHQIVHVEINVHDFLNKLFQEYGSDFDPLNYSSPDDALVPSDVIFGQRSYKDWVARRGNSLADIERIDGYTFACIIAVHVLRSLWLTDVQLSQNGDEPLADLSATVVSIDHSALLQKEIDRLHNDSLCACCTCLFFIANWPKRLNDVWTKAIKRGLGIRLF